MKFADTKRQPIRLRKISSPREIISKIPRWDDEVKALIQKRSKDNAVGLPTDWNPLISDTAWQITEDAVAKRTRSPTEAFIMSYILSHSTIPIPKVRRVLHNNSGSSWIVMEVKRAGEGGSLGSVSYGLFVGISNSCRRCPSLTVTYLPIWRIWQVLSLRWYLQLLLRGRCRSFLFLRWDGNLVWPEEVWYLCNPSFKTQ